MVATVTSDALFLQYSVRPGALSSAKVNFTLQSNIHCVVADKRRFYVDWNFSGNFFNPIEFSFILFAQNLSFADKTRRQAFIKHFMGKLSMDF